VSDLGSLGDQSIRLGARVDDWRAAIRLAGEVLRESGAVTDGYGERMVQIVEEYGSYIVIAPGLALAHARPGPDVLRGGLSVVTLAEPVVFGHPHNDPVSVVLGLAVQNSHDHINQVAELANIFNDGTAIQRIAAAKTPDEVRVVLGQA
jgi:PTS system ascorbate-specific IIA component